MRFSRRCSTNRFNNRPTPPLQAYCVSLSRVHNDVFPGKERGRISSVEMSLVPNRPKNISDPFPLDGLTRIVGKENGARNEHSEQSADYVGTA